MLSRMKTLLYGIFLIVLVGFGGLVYRNAVEHPNQPIACPMDAKICPDGTSVAREGLSCTFAECSLPNIMLADVGIAFAIPDGFTAAPLPESSNTIADFQSVISASTSEIWIQRLPINASSTALATIQANALSDGSGLPIPVTAFTSSVIGNHRFTVVQIGRFEGQINTAYFLARTTDVLSFTAIDRGVDSVNPNLNIPELPAHKALIKLLGTLQGS